MRDVGGPPACPQSKYDTHYHLERSERIPARAVRPPPAVQPMLFMSTVNVHLRFDIY